MGSSAQLLTVLIWSALLSGTTLVAIGFWRDTMRFRHWKRLRARFEGEIMPTGETLRAGQAAEITSEDEACRLPAALHETTDKFLTFSIEYAPGTSRQEIDWPAEGEQVLLTVTGETALYRFEAEVHDVRPHPDRAHSLLLAVERPLWVVRVQRRRHARAPLHAELTLESPGTREVPAHPRLPLPVKLVNLSGGGMRVEIGHGLPLKEAEELVNAFQPGTPLRVRLPIGGLAETPLSAEVRIAERAAVSGGVGVRLACEFLPMASWEQELLIQHVFRAQREYLQERHRFSHNAPLRHRTPLYKPENS